MLQCWLVTFAPHFLKAAISFYRFVRFVFLHFAHNTCGSEASVQTEQKQNMFKQNKNRTCYLLICDQNLICVNRKNFFKNLCGTQRELITKVAMPPKWKSERQGEIKRKSKTWKKASKKLLKNWNFQLLYKNKNIWI